MCVTFSLSVLNSLYLLSLGILFLSLLSLGILEYSVGYDSS